MLRFGGRKEGSMVSYSNEVSVRMMNCTGVRRCLENSWALKNAGDRDLRLPFTMKLQHNLIIETLISLYDKKRGNTAFEEEITMLEQLLKTGGFFKTAREVGKGKGLCKTGGREKEREAIKVHLENALRFLKKEIEGI